MYLSWTRAVSGCLWILGGKMSEFVFSVVRFYWWCNWNPCLAILRILSSSSTVGLAVWKLWVVYYLTSSFSVVGNSDCFVFHFIVLVKFPSCQCLPDIIFPQYMELNFEWISRLPLKFQKQFSFGSWGGLISCPVWALSYRT